MAENKLADLSIDFAVSILKVTDGIIEIAEESFILTTAWYLSATTMQKPFMN